MADYCQTAKKRHTAGMKVRECCENKGCWVLFLFVFMFVCIILGVRQPLRSCGSTACPVSACLRYPADRGRDAWIGFARKRRVKSQHLATRKVDRDG
eukprot:1634900-Pyramimonas_sp.AAC.2